MNSQSEILIRNDDPGYDTDINNLKRFCEICDEYGFQILQAVVPMGRCLGIDSKWTNEELISYGGTNLLTDNKEVYEYLLKRKEKGDIIGVHGLWHTHVPTLGEIAGGQTLLKKWGLFPDFFVKPFNEGEYPSNICDMKVSGKTTWLEDYIRNKPWTKALATMPHTNIMYTHSWRFGDPNWYSYEDLEVLLCKIKNMTS